MIHLLELPDEVLLKILGYLNGVDKLGVMNVCEHFKRIGLDRKMLKCYNFSNNYTFNLRHLRFLARKSTCSLVTVLNLNDVYWITSRQLRDNLVKFVNLAALYVCGTQLTSADLTYVLMHNIQIRKLAASLNHDSFCPGVNLPLTHLFIRYNKRAIKDLMSLLRKLVSLEELWIIEINQPIKCNVFSWWNPSNTALKVSKKIVIGRQNCKIPELGSFINLLKDTDTKWINTFDNVGETQFFVHEENNRTSEDDDTSSSAIVPIERYSNKIIHKELFDEFIDIITNNIQMKNVFSVSDQSKLFLNNLQPSQINYITSLNLVRSTDKAPIDESNLDIRIFKDFLFLPNLKHLRKLRTESIPFWENKEVEPSTEQVGVQRFKRPRLASQNTEQFDNSIFEQFTLNSPDMQDFELIDTTDFPVRHGVWKLGTLKYIQNWTMLKQLTITSVNFTNGKFLIDVTKQCKMLEVLKIYSNLMRDISSDVCAALRHAANLKDFRYECRGNMPLERVLDAVVQCKVLERLYLQSHSVSRIYKKSLITLLTQSRNLVFLFIYIKTLPDTSCKQITSSLKHLDLNPNLIFRVRGNTYNIDKVDNEDLPQSHIHDLITQSADLYFDCLRDF